MDKVTIIAELGINHDGSYEKAIRMLDATKLTGVKIAKFQHYDALKLLGPTSPYLKYASQCQFTKTQHESLKAYCDSIGLEYLVSVFDIADIEWADKLCQRHKVASRMNQDVKFMSALQNTGKEVIMSVQKQPELLLANFKYMYCITNYPTLESELDILPCNKILGLSSHCPSIYPTSQAITQGANLVEHHITFDRKDAGCDHASSITFEELKQLNKFANEFAIV